VPSVRSILGLILQLTVLTTLAATVGLGPVGWAAGAAYGLVMCGLLARALRRSAAAAVGPANLITLIRATLVGGVTALAVDALATGASPLDVLAWPLPGPEVVPVLVAVTTVALVLDAVDGQVARRTGTTTELGARFDMEVDAFLILVLSVYVAGSMGVWVLAIGGMRYAYVVASWALRWLTRPVPPRYWRKVVAATQGIVLTVAAAEVFPTPLVVVAVLAALALLVESFGRDVVWQWRRRVAVGRVVPDAASRPAVRDTVPSGVPARLTS
jgi:phosphatidylglycerophosphate synthase